MKVAAIIIALVAAVSAQDDGPECDCGMFITSWGDEIEVHRLPPFDIDDCDKFNLCKKKCAGEFDLLTGGGNLNHMLENGYTVGQHICLDTYTEQGIERIEDETVWGYARQCNGPWDWDGEFSLQRLCCHRGIHYDCDLVTGPPQI